MFAIETGDSKRIISELSDYMMEQGLSFKTINLKDSSPYAILTGKTSVGFRTKSKWNKTGIVFFCTKTDADNISMELFLPVDNNTDISRPYAIFSPDMQVPEVVQILKKNTKNVFKAAKIEELIDSQKLSSYQNKFGELYYSHVEKCLACDGYSDSYNNTETIVQDTFYLERQDPRDFLEWFMNEKTVAEAKERIAEFIWKRKGKTYCTIDNSTYAFVKTLKNKPNVTLVRNNDDYRLYVRKELKSYNQDVFKRLKEAKIDGLPQLIKIEKNDNILYTIEEYIEGNTVNELIEQNGLFNVNEICRITLELCRILKELHAMTLRILHRDIKPANIMINRQGKVYLIDFNASKEESENACEDTIFSSTLHFTAPEQNGYAASTPSSDVYGLASTLSYMMTGQYANRIVAPGKYQAILKKSLNMDPKDRYQSIAEFEVAFINA